MTGLLLRRRGCRVAVSFCAQSARAYWTKFEGVLRDAVVHQKKRVKKGGSGPSRYQCVGCHSAGDDQLSWLPNGTTHWSVLEVLQGPAIQEHHHSRSATGHDSPTLLRPVWVLVPGTRPMNEDRWVAEWAYGQDHRCMITWKICARHGKAHVPREWLLRLSFTELCFALLCFELLWLFACLPPLFSVVLVCWLARLFVCLIVFVCVYLCVWEFFEDWHPCLYENKGTRQGKLQFFGGRSTIYNVLLRLRIAHGWGMGGGGASVVCSLWGQVCAQHMLVLQYFRSWSNIEQLQSSDILLKWNCRKGRPLEFYS